MNDLAIVILHYNTPDDVSKNLEAFQQADIPEKTQFIVVNNGGHNANDKILKSTYENLNVRFFDIPNKGFPQGNNFGIAHTDAKIIAMVNPDIEIKKDTFSIILKYFEDHPKVGIISPRLIYPNNKTQDNYRTFPHWYDLIIKRIPPFRKMFLGRMRKYLMWEKDPSKNEAVDWTTGAFQVVSRECWDACGPNNEEYFLFMSDLEICWQAWEKDFQVHFIGQAQARHNETRLSEGGIADIFKKKTMRIHIKDAFAYFKKYWGKKFPR
ncbi:glycosyltransferase [Patescibacteria group bacterium]